MASIERKLQHYINKLQEWCDKNGFRFSSTKTVCVHFCRQRIPHLDPEIQLNGNPIPVVDETRFLGLIFDKKLSFISHITQLKSRCFSALNLLKVLANTSWGADRKILLRLYDALIRSKLDILVVLFMVLHAKVISNDWNPFIIKVCALVWVHFGLRQCRVYILKLMIRPYNLGELSSIYSIAHS